jgi:oligoribonuclease NrnB/cAMP/cGMP phosphodiesterase (DHH superfamily)
MKNINFLILRGSLAFPYWEHTKDKSEATHFTHNLFTSGDYCGSMVEKANRQVILEDSKLCERLGIESLLEDYSTETLIFPIAALEDEELKDILKKLEDYPLLDEDLHSELERELEQECFDLFGRHDFKEHLVTLFPDLEEKIEGLSTESIQSLYYEAARGSNYNIFEVESGTSGHFDFEGFGGLYDKQKPILKKLIEETK